MATERVRVEQEARESHAEGRTRSITSAEARLRKLATWIAVLGTWTIAAYFFGFLIYHSIRPTNSSGSWFLSVLEKHFAACLGVPLSAISAACIVMLLKATAGPIEFEGLGFKFRGASGPIILWMICFLAMILGVYLLWNR
jgi:hypothetical protein